MSFQALTWATRQKVGGVTGKAILLMLANYADRDGSCMPGQDTLADECECSPRAVRDWLTKFEAMGLIRREERRRDNGYRTSDRIILSLTVETTTSPAGFAGDQPAGFSGENGSGENASRENPSDLTGSICRANRTSKGNRKTLVSECARTAIDELTEVLDAEHASALIDHRKGFRAKFSARAAKLMAVELAKCSDPNAAADEIIRNGWQGFKARWVEERGRRPHAANGPPTYRRSQGEVMADLMAGRTSHEPNERTIDGTAERR